MPSVLFSEKNDGLYCYIAKQDLEARVLHIEFDDAACWGGNFELEGGKSYYIYPQPGKPPFPVRLRASKNGGESSGTGV
ncbi:NifT/FixU family protein [Sodalis sp. dw_96]|uniref:NifT/FixU family protein n=1 Tax=Sodalis sp. dw_96 TaxID=2719794 RepID=UPI001BD5453D|nr:NifT/FixU family protein [Sodalis sp. dw_96]